MKKSNAKLALRAQTIRLLAADALSLASGGVLEQVGAGDPAFIMKDSIIIRTSRG